MTDLNRFIPTEFKFANTEEPGVFEGYGSVFNNVDSHGDVVRPGAFSESLVKHQTDGTMPALYVEHSAFSGGDQLPVGKWLSVREDAKGLRVKGKLSALDTDHGRRVRGLMQDGALRGLSIVYRVPQGGAERPKNAGEATRILHKVDLHAIDVVAHPSNPRALVAAVKRAPGRFEAKAQLEDWLHEAGLPAAFAKKLVGGGWKAVSGNQSDDLDLNALSAVLRVQQQEMETFQLMEPQWKPRT